MQKPVLRRHLERGEGNAKFIMTMAVIALAGYIAYCIVPVYMQEEQIRHDLKELARISAINGTDQKKVERDVQSKVKSYPAQYVEALKVAVARKGDNITVDCNGTIPIKVLFFTYNYNISISETANRGGY
ncbi:MAG: hypothetical protein JNN15_16555 [Blastocatellia bacterium]|nr:hypothetical protein [Blastocatellia bacterium]